MVINAWDIPITQKSPRAIPRLVRSNSRLDHEANMNRPSMSRTNIWRTWRATMWTVTISRDQSLRTDYTLPRTSLLPARPEATPYRRQAAPRQYDQQGKQVMSGRANHPSHILLGRASRETLPSAPSPFPKMAAAKATVLPSNSIMTRTECRTFATLDPLPLSPASSKWLSMYNITIEGEVEDPCRRPLPCRC